MDPKAVAQAASRIRSWRASPVNFVREVFGIDPDLWQIAALDGIAVSGVSRLALRACAGPGKTAVLAWTAWWWLLCHAELGEHPKGIAVGVTADNLRSNLWPELAKWRARSPLLSASFEWQKERIFAKDHPETWFIAARSYSGAADPDEQARVLSGLHSRYPIVLLDESGDMPPSVGRAAEQAMGGCSRGLIIQAGNTTSQSGLLYDSCIRHREGWRITAITADPDEPARTPRVPIEWAREQIERYGRESPWVQSYILGQFPDAATNALLSAAQVEAALGRHVSEELYRHAARIIGVDCARFGDDSTVITRRQGLASYTPRVLRGARSEQIAAAVATIAQEWGHVDAIMVDGGGGYGAGTIDALRLAGFQPLEVLGSGEPIDRRYLNKRAEMWSLMADWIKGGGCLSNTPEYAAELTAPTYWLRKDRLQLEDKDQIKKRIGRSPDTSDALALTFSMPVIPRANAIPAIMRAERSRNAIDYDPFSR